MGWRTGGGGVCCGDRSGVTVAYAIDRRVTGWLGGVMFNNWWRWPSSRRRDVWSGACAVLPRPATFNYRGIPALFCPTIHPSPPKAIHRGSRSVVARNAEAVSYRRFPRPHANVYVYIHVYISIYRPSPRDTDDRSRCRQW